MSDSFEVVFIDGPLDGISLLHQEDNRYTLRVKDNSEGFYLYRSDLRYHWIDNQSKLFNEPF